jgi:hypothetical protein
MMQSLRDLEEIRDAHLDATSPSLPADFSLEHWQTMAVRIQHTRQCFLAYLALCVLSMLTLIWELSAPSHSVGLIIVESLINVGFLVEVLTGICASQCNYFHSWPNVVDCVLCLVCISLNVVFVVSPLTADSAPSLANLALMGVRYAVVFIRLSYFAWRSREYQTRLAVHDADGGISFDELHLTAPTTPTTPTSVNHLPASDDLDYAGPILHARVRTDAVNVDIDHVHAHHVDPGRLSSGREFEDDVELTPLSTSNDPITRTGPRPR